MNVIALLAVIVLPAHPSEVGRGAAEELRDGIRWHETGDFAAAVERWISDCRAFGVEARHVPVGRDFTPEAENVTGLIGAETPLVMRSTVQHVCVFGKEKGFIWTDSRARWYLSRAETETRGSGS